ncbi:MAG: CPBP family intramembrane metalloprotease [Oscillospiraceae bacterium]|nr:CPBP family intramembrane metalloprotease [Oscillospiraceae bacterium]
MPTTMRKSEMMFGCIYYTLSYFLFPSVVSLASDTFSIPLWCCQFGLFLSNFLFSVGIFHRFLLQDGKLALSKPGKILQFTVLGLVFYYTANLIVRYGIFLIRPEYINLNDQRIINLARDGGIWIAAGTVVLVPTAEELLFRGLLFEAVRHKKPIIGWLLSAAAFSAVHILGYIGSYDFISFCLAFVQYLPAGLCLAWAYRASGTIFAPIAMHTIINLIGVLILL